MKTAIAKVLFMGKPREVFLNPGQFGKIQFNGQNFTINFTPQPGFKDLQETVAEFGLKYLKDRVKRTMANLQNKKVQVKLKYLQGKKEIYLTKKLSVNDYLKEMGFEKEIHLEFGHSTKEWGVNYIDNKKKKFKLFFNKNLILYDSASHIDYVVGHELGHVFVRDHGPEFNKVVAQLHSGKTSSESFFKSGIGKLFPKKTAGKKQASGGKIVYIFVFVILLFLAWQMLNLFGAFWQSLVFGAPNF